MKTLYKVKVAVEEKPVVVFSTYDYEKMLDRFFAEANRGRVVHVAKELVREED